MVNRGWVIRNLSLGVFSLFAFGPHALAQFDSLGRSSSPFAAASTDIEVSPATIDGENRGLEYGSALVEIPTGIEMPISSAPIGPAVPQSFPNIPDLPAPQTAAGGTTVQTQADVSTFVFASEDGMLNYAYSYLFGQGDDQNPMFDLPGNSSPRIPPGPSPHDPTCDSGYSCNLTDRCKAVCDEKRSKEPGWENCKCHGLYEWRSSGIWIPYRHYLGCACGKP